VSEDGRTLLEVADLGVRFGGVQAVRNVSFCLEAGKIVGVMGPNGAGKTTLFNLITGIYRPSCGTVHFGGRPMHGLPPSRVCHAGISRTFQSVRPFGNLTALENILVGIHFGSGRQSPSAADARRQAFEILRLVGLGDRGDRPVASLNLMEKKFVELARALATRPKLLLLDELLAGLNPLDLGPAIRLILRIRDECGVTIIWIEHIMKVLMETCEHLLVLHHGEKLAEGSPSEVTADPCVVEAYFGKKKGVGFA